MKGYTVPLSLVGACLALAGILAYGLDAGDGTLGLVNLGLGIVLVVAAGVLNPDLFRQYGRWLNAFWGVLMVLGIILMVNFLGVRYHQRFDWTAGKLHSLSDLTTETLANLPVDVQALAFMEEGKNDKLESLLKEFSVQGSRFDFEMVDPDRDPERTVEYGVQTYNTLVLATAEKQQKVTELNEKEITNALLKVVRDRQEKVYLTVGHGEVGAGDGERDLGQLRARLEDFGYTIEDSLLIARQGQIPQDCAVLLIAAPKTPFFDSEIQAIQGYLAEGGAAFILLDPLYRTGLEETLSQWGVQIGEDFVIDNSGIGSLFGLDATSPVVVSYGEHPITQKHRGLMTIYELVRSVRFEGGQPGLEGVSLASTSESGWAETDLSVLQSKGNHSVEMNKGVDTPGPISLGVAVQSPQGGRLVVFGDADFAGNRYFNTQGNGDLALNILSWLAEDEGLISIRPRESGYNPIALTESQSETIFWVTVVLYPVLIGVVGLMVVSRQGRWSVKDLMAVGLGVVLSLGVVALVNFIGNRYHYRYDLTQGQLFTLSDDTKSVLERVNDKNYYVSVKTFMAKEEGMRFQEVMDEYKYVSANFDYEILDPQKKTLEVQQYGIRERGTSVIDVLGDGKVRSERITAQSEEALSNAIQRALRSEDKKIFFTSGHGEGRLADVDSKGFSSLNGRIKEMNFQIVEGLELAQGIPADATMLGILAPKQAFSEAEAAVVADFLNKGKSAFILLDPGIVTGLEGVLDEYSIELGQDFIVDLNPIGRQLFGADVSVPVILRYGRHAITEKLPQGTLTFFPLSRSVNVADHQRRNPQIEPLLQTDPNSWGETDLGPITGSSGQVEFNEEIDRQGPLSLGVAVTADADTSVQTQEKTRLVIIGDSDFATNQYFAQQANGALAVSSIEWLAEGEDKLSIETRSPSFNPINLVSNSGEVILWVSVFILPFAVALSGLVIMLRRGYDTHAGGFIIWLMYTFSGSAVFFFIQGVIGLGEGDFVRGQGYLLLAFLEAAVAFGIFRRDPLAWVPALGLAVVNAGVGFVAIPYDVGQLIYAGLFIANAALLVWIKKAFLATEE
jgi:ABC-type uncharacterized transport system involved in gliding motility auxiliary subunit